MKPFREQFFQCRALNYNTKTVFKSFSDFPELLPLFLNEKMREAIGSGEMKGVNINLCGRFGGECRSGNTDCIILRNI